MPLVPVHAYNPLMTTLAVLASFNMDLVMRVQRRPLTGETLQGEFEMFLGGKGFNQAIAARRLGAEVRVVGRVGRDQFGDRFVAALDEAGIDARAVQRTVQAGTGVASVLVEPDGANSIVQAPRANRLLTPDDVLGTDFAGVSAALLNLETSMPAALQFARLSHAAGAIVVCNPAPAGSVPSQLLALSDVVVPNALEASGLTGLSVETPDQAFAAADALRSQGPAIIVVTLGAIGAIVVAGGVRERLPAYAVPVVDTVGAGDAFCAALAVRVAEGAPLMDSVRFANAAGAIATQRAGAEPSMPTRSDVEAILAASR